MMHSFDTYMDFLKEKLSYFLSKFTDIFYVLSNYWVSFGIVAFFFTVVFCFCIAKYRKSFKAHIEKSKTLVICAMMIAINIVLGYFTVWVSGYLRISFGFITQPIIAILFGPLTACMTGIIQDIISLMLNPTGAYIPAYGLCVGISGMIYGIMLYNKPVKLWRVFVAEFVVIIICNIILNSIALAPTAGSGFVGILPSRLIKNLIMLPIQTGVVYVILKILKTIKIK